MAENMLALQQPPFPRDHNNPPLGEQLAIELQPFVERGQPLVETAGKAVIIDDESAGKVIDLAAKLKSLADELEAARVARVAPFLEAQRLVNAAFGNAMRPLVQARGPTRTDGLRGMVDAYEKKRSALAAAERQRLEDEQRKREAEAEAARQAAEAARATGDVGTRERLAALAAEEDAAALARRAAAVRPVPIRSTLGQVSSKRGICFDVIDLRKITAWMVKQQSLKNALEAEVRTLMGRYLRTLGVAGVEAGVDIPGLKAWTEAQTDFRR